MRTSKVDNHGAAKSGREAERLIHSVISQWDPNIVTVGPKVQIPLLPIYKAAGNKKPFLADAWSDTINAWIEIKHTKQRRGSAQEKVGFDFEKMVEGAYTQGNRRLVYILSGYMESDTRGNWLKLVVDRARKSQRHFRNIRVVNLSDCTPELWNTMFSQKQPRERLSLF